MTTCDVAIVGAGPYGLSIAAYLRAHRVDFRIFGRPMQTWAESMPKSMRLKSEGFASSLYDPESAFALASYCRSKGLPYADIGLPVPLETFVSYGLAFQERCVPELQANVVAALQRTAKGFQLCIDGGEARFCQGSRDCGRLDVLRLCAADSFFTAQGLVSHSSAHRTVDSFIGREVAVVGAGASALDLAAELHEGGALAEIICRQPSVRIHDPPDPLPSVGLCSHSLPDFADRKWLEEFSVQQCPFAVPPDAASASGLPRSAKSPVRPADGSFGSESLARCPFNVGVEISSAAVEGNRARLELTDKVGTRKTLVADHVIAATGYRVDLRRLTFMDPTLQSEIQAVEHTPVLSSNFESSVPGLYFVGTSAANTFGPLLRFACGARFTAQRLSRHLGNRHGIAEPIMIDASVPRGA